MDGNFFVYQDAKLSKQMKALLRGGANGAAAAKHAQSIIEQLMNEGARAPKLMGRLTKYGEARIKNCVKFDLVRGYRLIGVLLDGGITFLYVGSHDECDHWIRNNAGLEPILDKKRNTVVELRETDPGQTPSESDPEEEAPEPDYDKLLLRNLTEQDLAKIFSGLCCRKSQ
ncbi:MAG: hypothetical protein ACP5SH_08365 [Syntrophobacteraceae bacterium]